MIKLYAKMIGLHDFAWVYVILSNLSYIILQLRI